MWLYKKIENRINIWENRSLSRGGRLILLKAVLQSIIVYWASIAYIPKGILTKIRKLCFSFLSTTNKQLEGIALANWKTLAKPKKLGGWGIKNIDVFNKYLAAKTLHRFIQNPETLWGKVILTKYCSNNSITEWLRNPDKTFRNGSIGWKEMVLAYPLIGHWIGWQIGDGRKVRVGEDLGLGKGKISNYHHV